MSAAEHLKTLRSLTNARKPGSSERVALEFAILAVIALDPPAPEQPAAQGDEIERVAKAIADVIGHGMREKCHTHAVAALAALQRKPANPV